MKYTNKNICKCCNRKIPKSRGKKMSELQDDLHRELKIKPDGLRVDKSPYWHFHKKDHMIRVIEAIKKMKGKL